MGRVYLKLPYKAPECVSVAIAPRSGILTGSNTQNAAMTLLILDFSSTSLQDGGDLGTLE